MCRRSLHSEGKREADQGITPAIEGKGQKAKVKESWCKGGVMERFLSFAFFLVFQPTFVVAWQ